MLSVCGISLVWPGWLVLGVKISMSASFALGIRHYNAILALSGATYTSWTFDMTNPEYAPHNRMSKKILLLRAKAMQILQMPCTASTISHACSMPMLGDASVFTIKCGPYGRS